MAYNNDEKPNSYKPYILYWQNGLLDGTNIKNPTSVNDSSFEDVLSVVGNNMIIQGIFNNTFSKLILALSRHPSSVLANSLNETIFHVHKLIYFALKGNKWKQVDQNQREPNTNLQTALMNSNDHYNCIKLYQPNNTLNQFISAGFLSNISATGAFKYNISSKGWNFTFDFWD